MGLGLVLYSFHLAGPDCKFSPFYKGKKEKVKPSYFLTAHVKKEFLGLWKMKEE